MITLKTECKHCKKIFKINVEEKDYRTWVSGGLIQEIMWYLSPEERELLISQTCDSCWNKMFREKRC